MYELGAIIAGIITLVIATLYFLTNVPDNDERFQAILLGTLGTAITAALSWISVGSYIIIGITYFIYTKFIKKELNDK
ncbi:MAG: hypothetical protein PVF17_04440 [Ignavibacteria bacterium]|jgi:hypothetical protein